MATGSKSSRITPLEGEAFFTSAIRAVPSAFRRAARKSRTGGASTRRSCSVFSGVRSLRKAISVRLVARISDSMLIGGSYSALSDRRRCSARWQERLERSGKSDQLFQYIVGRSGHDLSERHLYRVLPGLRQSIDTECGGSIGCHQITALQRTGRVGAAGEDLPYQRRVRLQSGGGRQHLRIGRYLAQSQIFRG